MTHHLLLGECVRWVWLLWCSRLQGQGHSWWGEGPTILVPLLVQTLCRTLPQEDMMGLRGDVGWRDKILQERMVNQDTVK